MLTKEFEFIVADTELEDRSKVYDVIGYDGFTKVTFNAIDQRHAEAIARAINAGTRGFSAETFELGLGHSHRGSKTDVRAKLVFEKLRGVPSPTTISNTEEQYIAMIAAPRGQPKSILDQLNAEEASTLEAWRREQRGDPDRGGAIDLMAWPGWGQVLARQCQER